MKLSRSNDDVVADASPSLFLPLGKPRRLRTILAHWTLRLGRDPGIAASVTMHALRRRETAEKQMARAELEALGGRGRGRGRIRWMGQADRPLAVVRSGIGYAQRQRSNWPQGNCVPRLCSCSSVDAMTEGT